jgi:hypothetical protein
LGQRDLLYIGLVALLHRREEHGNDRSQNDQVDEVVAEQPGSHLVRKP